MAPTGEYVEVVKNWPMPKTRKALRGFIGKVERTGHKRMIGNVLDPNVKTPLRAHQEMTHYDDIAIPGQLL